jgi:phenylpyruvate tautomerase PptA (4-oxalocrotonate tautomerase family)
MPIVPVQEVSNDVTSQELIAKEVTEFMLTAGSVRVSDAAQQHSYACSCCCKP